MHVSRAHVSACVDVTSTQIELNYQIFQNNKQETSFQVFPNHLNMKQMLYIHKEMNT